MLSSFKFLHEKKNEVRKRKLMGLIFCSKLQTDKEPCSMDWKNFK